MSFQGAGQGDEVAEVGMSRSYPSHKHRGAVRVEGGHWSFLDPGLQRYLTLTGDYTNYDFGVHLSLLRFLIWPANWAAL